MRGPPGGDGGCEAVPAAVGAASQSRQQRRPPHSCLLRSLPAAAAAPIGPFRTAPVLEPGTALSVTLTSQGAPSPETPLLAALQAPPRSGSVLSLQRPRPSSGSTSRCSRPCAALPLGARALRPATRAGRPLRPCGCLPGRTGSPWQRGQGTVPMDFALTPAIACHWVFFTRRPGVSQSLTQERPGGMETASSGPLPAQLWPGALSRSTPRKSPFSRVGLHGLTVGEPGTCRHRQSREPHSLSGLDFLNGK